MNADFWSKHWDKLLLCVIYIVIVHWSVFIYFHRGDSEFLHVITSWAAQVLAALLTLMVGSRGVPRKDDAGGNGAITNQGKQ